MPIDDRLWEELSVEEQTELYLAQLHVQRWNESRPEWDGKPWGTHAGKKQAGRPSAELERKRGYVT